MDVHDNFSPCSAVRQIPPVKPLRPFPQSVERAPAKYHQMHFLFPLVSTLLHTPNLTDSQLLSLLAHQILD